MRKPSAGIVPEGLPIILLLALATVACAMLGWGCLAILFFLLCAFACSFFRDPERVIDHDKDVATSPADGKIVAITKRPNPFGGEPRCCVSVFMSLFNVHVNRVPASGIITDIHYHEGKFINATLNKASEGNERCAYELTDAAGDRWVFVQIAGLVARRIVPWVTVGDAVKRGQRFGLIRFGSRVDLYLPDGYGPICRVGQRVFAGQTALARKGVAGCGATVAAPAGPASPEEDEPLKVETQALEKDAASVVAGAESAADALRDKAQEAGAGVEEALRKAEEEAEAALREVAQKADEDLRKAAGKVEEAAEDASGLGMEVAGAAAKAADAAENTLSDAATPDKGANNPDQDGRP